jgi:hypothetical protein
MSGDAALLNVNGFSDERSDQKAIPTVYFDLIEILEPPAQPRIKIGESGNHGKRNNEKDLFVSEFSELGNVFYAAR